MFSTATKRTLLATAILALARPAQAAPPPVHFAIDQDYDPTRQSVQRVVQDFALIRKLGVHTLRTGIGWDDTNPHRGKFDWRFWKRVILRARAAGIAVQPYYAYTPQWAGHAYNAPPRNVADFADACFTMARTIGHDVPGLEIWNEPDNTAFWTGSAEEYGNLARACTRAIRKATPDLPAILGGLVYLDTKWFDKTGLSAPSGYDVAAFHMYTETPWDSTTVEQATSPAGYYPGYDRLSEKRTVPVRMDEGGATTSARQGYSEHSQASWIRRTLASLLSEPERPLTVLGLYQLRDPDPATSKPIGDKQARRFFLHTGVFTKSAQPKLGAETYADLVHLFEGERPEIEPRVSYTASAGQPSADFRLHAWQLGNSRQVVTIWDTRAVSSGTITLQHRGTTAWRHNPDGTLHRVGNFTGTTLPVPEIAPGQIPILYEVRNSP